MGLLSALLGGCATSGRPAKLSDYEATLHPRHALQIDPAVASNGRYEVVAGDKLVLRLHARRGTSARARDKGADWSIAIELPGPAPAVGQTLSLEGAPSIARVASEDVVYLARGARGHVTLTSPTAGELELAFEAPEKDLIQLGPLRVAGTFEAK